MPTTEDLGQLTDMAIAAATEARGDAAEHRRVGEQGPPATHAIAAYRSGGVGLQFSAADKALIYDVAKRSLTANSGGTISQAEFDYFLAVCSIRGLNPLLREAHLIKDNSGAINVQVGIDGFRALAEDTGQYAGQTPVEYEYAPRDPAFTIRVAVGREYRDIGWAGRPSYARVGVYRAGAAEPFYGESWIEEDFNGNADTGMWRRRPHTMLAKVAEARACRRAFPRSLSGVYAEGELTDDAPRLVEGTAVTVSEAPGAPEGAGVAPDASEGEFRVPEPVPPPQGGGTAGEVVKVDPEAAYRSVRVSWLADNDVHRKVEVKLAVPGRGKITAILLDELAEAVADLTPALAAGDHLWVDDAKIVERAWGRPEDKKPPIKELHAVTAARVLRGEAWVELALPGPAEGSGPPPAAERSPSGPATPAEDDEPPPLAVRFEPPPPTLPPLANLVAGSTVDVSGAIILLEHKSAARAVLGLIAGGYRFRCVLDGEEEIGAQLLDAAGDWLYDVGEKVRIVGVEVGGWVALTSVGPPA